MEFFRQKKVINILGRISITRENWSSHLSPVHPGEESGPPAQGVATEPQHGPGQEVAPGDQVEEEDVHEAPTDDNGQHYEKPERTTQPALDLVTQLRLPLEY